MPPTVILIRHGQALHNIKNGTKSWESHILDPPLTDLGFKQCAELQAYFRSSSHVANNVELIVSSPLLRTMQTTHASLTWLIDRGVPVMARAEWQENSDKPCDTGSDRSKLSIDFPNVDYSKLHPDWPSKTGIFAYTRDAVDKRAANEIEWLRNRPEKVIAVVSHSAFLRLGVAHAFFANADYRVFDFREADFTEWEITSTAGGGMRRSNKGRAEVGPSDFRPEPEE